MNLISSDIQFRHAIEVLHRYTEHIIFKISIMTDIMTDGISNIIHQAVILNH